MTLRFKNVVQLLLKLPNYGRHHFSAASKVGSVSIDGPMQYNFFITQYCSWKLLHHTFSDSLVWFKDKPVELVSC